MGDRPNILIIQGDEHRFDCIGVFGNSEVQTTQLDLLASDGVQYQESFCSFPACAPSRYSLLSGLYSHQHLGRSNYCTIPAGLPTFPRVLRDSGYRTKAVGKMHLTPTYLDVGFQEMILAEQHGPGRYDDDYHRWLYEEGLYDRIDLMDQVKVFREKAEEEYWEKVGAMESNLDEAHHSTTWIGNQAVETLEGWEGNGHLLMVSFIKPHHPFDPPPTWSQMYDPDQISLLPGYTQACLPQDLALFEGYFPNCELTESKIRRATAFYYATISHIDHQIGRMVQVLKRKGLYDSMVILYNSDHGDYMGYHHLLLKGNYMYDPLIKVPLIVKYPSQKNRGMICNGLVNTIDLGPTLLTLAGCKVPDTMKGLNLMEDPDRRELIFAESGTGYMVRSKNRKLLLCKRVEQSQFFNLEEDPYELNNLFENPAYREEVVAFKEAVSRWVLFESPSPVHLDEKAPVILGKNMLVREGPSRFEIEAYFWKKMTEN